MPKTRNLPILFTIQELIGWTDLAYKIGKLPDLMSASVVSVMNGYLNLPLGVRSTETGIRTSYGEGELLHRVSECF